MSGETNYYVGNNGDIFIDNHRAIYFITGATHSGTTIQTGQTIYDLEGLLYWYSFDREGSAPYPIYNKVGDLAVLHTGSLSDGITETGQTMSSYDSFHNPLFQKNRFDTLNKASKPTPIPLYGGDTTWFQLYSTTNLLTQVSSGGSYTICSWVQGFTDGYANCREPWYIVKKRSGGTYNSYAGLRPMFISTSSLYLVGDNLLQTNWSYTSPLLDWVFICMRYDNTETDINITIYSGSTRTDLTSNYIPLFGTINTGDEYILGFRSSELVNASVKTSQGMDNFMLFNRCITDDEMEIVKNTI